MAWVSFSKVVPTALAGNSPSGEGVWGGEFRLGAGESVLICSPSGRGKTTLLQLLYGIRRDYSGNISIDGVDLRSLTNENWLRLRQFSISMVFQELRLFDHLSALENIELVRAITGAVSRCRLQEMACALGVADLLHKPCGLLSSGQRQRIAIIRALARPFALLLLDEPFSHLDHESALLACSTILKRQEELGASLIVTGLEKSCPLPVERLCEL